MQEPPAPLLVAIMETVTSSSDWMTLNEVDLAQVREAGEVRGRFLGKRACFLDVLPRDQTMPGCWCQCLLCGTKGQVLGTSEQLSFCVCACFRAGVIQEFSLFCWSQGSVRFCPRVAMSPCHAPPTRPLQRSACLIACVFFPVASCCRSYGTLSVELIWVLLACVYLRRRLHLETVFKEEVKMKGGHWSWIWSNMTSVI